MSTKRILLAEDSPAVQTYFQAMLAGAGYEVITAADGLEAVERFFRDQPDLVVSDVEMPIMNGYHVCRLIRNEPAAAGVPIIILTSLSEARFKYWGLELGADHYLLKEEAEEQLLPTVAALLAKRAFDPGRLADVAGRYANSSGILDHLNHMLDEKLFRLTLTNTIAHLAFENNTLNHIARQVLETLRNVVSAESAAITLVDTEEIRFFLQAGPPIRPDYIETFSLYSLDRLQEYAQNSLESARFELEYFCELAESGLSFPERPSHDFFRRVSDEVQMALHLVPPDGQTIPTDSLALVEFLMDFLSITLVHTFMHEKVKSLSVIDSLTRLYNKGQFLNLMNNEYRRSIRHQLDLSVIFLDIDKFKAVNDTYGHLSGDLVLKALAETILTTLRKSDVAGRYGGEEFVIYLPETNLENAAMLAERLRRNMAQRAVPISRTESLSVTVSLGVATLAETDPAPDVDRLLDIADQKLYRAKAQGRNRVVW